jgi:hypothetical protein
VNKHRSVEAITRAKEALSFEEEAFLRERGWKHTSATPGSYWLWEREHEGRVILVQTNIAMNMEAWFEGARCECDEENEDSSKCPVHGEEDDA